MARWIKTPKEVKPLSRKERMHCAQTWALAGSSRPTSPQAQAVRDQMDGWIEAGQVERAPRVEHEAAEQQELATRARTRWWFPGFSHQPQEGGGEIRGAQMRQRGQRAGLQDVEVLVPARRALRPDVGVDVPWPFPALRLGLELKAPSARWARDDLHPGPGWWLTIEYEGTPTDPEGLERTHYGLRGKQAKRLRLLNACGYQTMVAYSAEEALAWIESQVGPEPVEIQWP